MQKQYNDHKLKVMFEGKLLFQGSLCVEILQQSQKQKVQQILNLSGIGLRGGRGSRVKIEQNCF